VWASSLEDIELYPTTSVNMIAPSLLPLGSDDSALTRTAEHRGVWFDFKLGLTRDHRG